MLKRGKRYYGEYFIFRVIPQYSNKNFSQRAFQIPLKIDKSAATRNMLKRACFFLLANNEGFVSPKQVKVFASINKKKAESLKELIATQPKNAIVNQWKTFVKKDLKFLSWKL